MKTQKINTWLPRFSGFYESLYSFNDNDMEYMLFNCPNDVKKNYPKVYDWIFDNLYRYENYSDYETDTAKAYTKVLLAEIRKNLPELSAIITDIEFQSIYSPKEYNFSTDSINIGLIVDIEKLINLFKSFEGAPDYIKEKYSSYDGFISHYPSDIAVWLADMDNLEHKAGAMLDCLISPMFDGSKDLELSIYEQVKENISEYNYIDYDRLIADINEEFCGQVYNCELDKVLALTSLADANNPKYASRFTLQSPLSSLSDLEIA